MERTLSKKKKKKIHLDAFINRDREREREFSRIASNSTIVSKNKKKSNDDLLPTTIIPNDLNAFKDGSKVLRVASLHYQISID